MASKTADVKINSTNAAPQKAAEKAQSPPEVVSASSAQKAVDPKASGQGSAVAQAKATLEGMLAANAVYADDKRAAASPPRPTTAAIRSKLAKDGQFPAATVIACADSRVPPELMFRSVAGEIFVLRTAGNVTDDLAVMASLEYAIAVLKTPLVLVLGHEKCGAVKAAITLKSDPNYKKSLPTHLLNHVEKMSQAVDEKAVKDLPENQKVTKVVENHARRAAKAIVLNSQVAADAEKAGNILIKAAVYDIDSGLVRVL